MDIDSFLKTQLSDFTRKPLAGDASFRRYERVTSNGKSYVLMIAPADKEDTKPFVAMTYYLHEIGLSAPKIIAYDNINGLILLEDLGDDLYNNVLHSNNETTLYNAAIDALTHLHKQKHAPLAPYDWPTYKRELQLYSQWYKPEIDEDVFLSCWKDIINSLPKLPEVVVLRDYHADNLLWLSSRYGVAKVGQLDYQDALIGSPAYDLVSLLEDARRDVSPTLQQQSIEYFLANNDYNKDDFMQHYHVIGAQRNLKILGIFVRLAKRDGKKQYLDFLPRVETYLQQDLQHPALADLKKWV